MFLKKSIVTLTVLLTLLFNLLPAKAEIAEEWNLKGNEYLEAKEYNKALECYEQSLKIDPNYARSVCNIGIVYARNREYDKALQYYDKALNLVESKKDTSSSPLDKIYNNKGTTLINLRKYEEAINCFNKALEINPKNSLAWNNKGTALDDFGKYEEAITCYNKATQIDPNYVLAWNNKGNTLKKLERYEEAITCYDKILEIDPNYTNAQQNRDIVSSKISNSQSNNQQNNSNKDKVTADEYEKQALRAWSKEAAWGTWVYEDKNENPHKYVIILSETRFKCMETWLEWVPPDSMVPVESALIIEGEGNSWIYEASCFTLFFERAKQKEIWIKHPYRFIMTIKDEPVPFYDYSLGIIARFDYIDGSWKLCYKNKIFKKQ